MKYNTSIQIYRNIYIRLIEYTPEHFAGLKAKAVLKVHSNIELGGDKK